MPTSDLISSWLNNRFFPSTSAATGGHITASIYVTPWEQFTREKETQDLKGNGSSHLSWQDCLNNTIPPDLQEIFGELQDPWKSIAVCFNTRAAPTYFMNFYRRSIPCTHLWPPPPPPLCKLPLAASPAPREAKSQGTNAKGKKVSAHRPCRAANSTRQELAGRMWFPCWLGTGDESGSGGSCSLGTPGPGQGWDTGMDKLPHKDLAHRQNNLFPHKFCRSCWFKAGLHCYFNIVFCSFNAMWGFFLKCWWIHKCINHFFFFWFPKTPYFFIASAVNYVIKIREIKWSQKEGKGQQE